MDDSFDTTFADILFGTIFLFLSLFGLVLLLDGVSYIASRHKRYACEVRNLEPVRKDFSTQVTCRPRYLGSDTLNVKGVNENDPS